MDWFFNETAVFNVNMMRSLYIDSSFAEKNELHCVSVHWINGDTFVLKEFKTREDAVQFLREWCKDEK